MIRTVEPHKAALRAGSSKWQPEENVRAACLEMLCTSLQHKHALLVFAAWCWKQSGNRITEDLGDCSIYSTHQCGHFTNVASKKQFWLKWVFGNLNLLFSYICFTMDFIRTTHMWLEVKSSVKWILPRNYKPSLLSRIVNHSSIYFCTHFNNEAGKILWSTNEETVIKDVLPCM